MVTCISRKNTYLQWTTMGPASEGLMCRTRRRNMRKGDGWSGTPWSGQAVNWNCRISRRSKLPDCKQNTRELYLPNCMYLYLCLSVYTYISASLFLSLSACQFGFADLIQPQMSFCHPKHEYFEKTGGTLEKTSSSSPILTSMHTF